MLFFLRNQLPLQGFFFRSQSLQGVAELLLFSFKIRRESFVFGFKISRQGELLLLVSGGEALFFRGESLHELVLPLQLLLESRNRGFQSVFLVDVGA